MSSLSCGLNRESKEHPKQIDTTHLSDEFTHLRIDGWTSESRRPAFSYPIMPKVLLVLTDHSSDFTSCRASELAYRISHSLTLNLT
jgi:hypothetical protein